MRKASTYNGPLHFKGRQIVILAILIRTRITVMVICWATLISCRLGSENVFIHI